MLQKYNCDFAIGVYFMFNDNCKEGFIRTMTQFDKQYSNLLVTLSFMAWKYSAFRSAHYFLGSNTTYRGR